MTFRATTEPRDLPELLTTDRLELRIPRPGDCPALADAVRASLPELKPWLPWATEAYGIAEADAWARRAYARFILREGATYLMFERDGGAIVGGCGAHDINWKISKTEIGYWTRSDRAGRGYMREALTAVTESLTALGLRRIQVRCDPNNLTSAAVARRCGYTLEGTYRCDMLTPTGEPCDTHVFARINV